MPDISIQQAYALAFGAYASPNGNSSFTIQGANGLPANTTRLSGLLRLPNIDLRQIPSEAGDTPFNPVTATYSLATSTSTAGFAEGGEPGFTTVATTGTNDQTGNQNSKLLRVTVSDTVSGNLPIGSQTVYVSSIAAPGANQPVLPASSNITVSSAEGPHPIARLWKTSGGSIVIDILKSYAGDSNFWNVQAMQNQPVGDGLDISITGSTTNSGFNTVGNPPNNPKFNLKAKIQYELTGVTSWDENGFYFGTEVVEYQGSYYVCIDNTTIAHELPTNTDFFELIDPLETTFDNIQGNTITYLETTVNSIPTFRITIPVAHYSQQVLGENGRLITNPNWMPVWISLTGNTTVVDADTGGGTAGNQCGTLSITPKNNAYAKGSEWLLVLSTALPPNNTIIINGNPQLTFIALQNSTLLFSTFSSGGSIVQKPVYLFGGDINTSTTVTQTEKNYHRTGIGIVNKIKK